MDLIINILPVVTKDLPISPRFTPYNFLSRCKFSTLTTCQPMAKFYLLTFPRFPLRKKKHESYFGKNRTHDFRTSRCAGYLQDHSGNEGMKTKKVNHHSSEYSSSPATHVRQGSWGNVCVTRCMCEYIREQSCVRTAVGIIQYWEGVRLILY